MFWSLLNAYWEPLHRYLPKQQQNTPSMFASSSIVVDVHVGLIVQTFSHRQFWSATSARDTSKHIETGSAAEIAIYFKLSFPYLSRSISLRPLRAFLSLSSFPPNVFQLGLRFTLPSSERMAARLLGSPPAQIAFARAQNLWTAMIKSHRIIIECLSTILLESSPMRL